MNLFKIIFILVLSLCLHSCNNDKHSTSNQLGDECILLSLPRTLDYLKKIEALQKISSDTNVELEKLKLGDKTYTTFLDIKENEIKTWINIVNDKGEINQIELHQEDYVEYLLKVSTVFDTNKCEAIRVTETLNLETNRISIKKEKIDMLR